MDPPISNQLQEPGDEEDDNNCRTNNNGVAIQEPARDSLFDYVAAADDQDHDLLQEKSLEYYSKWCELVSSCTAVSTAPSPRKAFNVASSSQKLKAAKARRIAAEIVEVHGGRILRTPGRKDRHSKVCTARGARDRRVRLSPKTAIEFYDVQDRLGYDRPSKAIDWLMKEAKAAIDALDKPPPLAAAAAAATDNIQFKAQHQQMQEDSYTNPVSSLGFFTNGIAQLPSSELHGCITDNDSSTRRSGAHQDSINVLPSYHQEGPSLSALINTTTHPEMYDANLEMARLQRGFAYACAGSVDPAHFPGHSDNSHNNMSYQREPLQSSHVTYNYSPFTSNECNPGISFTSHDFPNVAAAEDQRDNKVPVSINPATFLHYEG